MRCQTADPPAPWRPTEVFVLHEVSTVTMPFWSRSLGNALAVSSLLVAFSGCGGDAANKGTSFPAEGASPPQVSFVTTEQAWLARVGTGREQTARACGRGATDRVARVLCGSESSKISSLDELYRALSLGPGTRRVAATTHSLGLSMRTVSAANPRVFVLADNSVEGGLSYEGIVATAFSRGEQLVELVAVDPATYEYNFYLVSFVQECNRSRCTPEQLLGVEVESRWTGWTLYSDADLEDTPLDCLSCHRPFGENTHKLLQMRQDFDPWMHWSDFRQLDENGCPSRPPEGVAPHVVGKADGLDLLTALEGGSGAYAGVPLPELGAAASGDVMTDFLADAEVLITAAPIPPHPYVQFSLRTRETLCERFQTGQSPSWEEDRRLSRARGLPFPYHSPDVLDPALRERLAANRAEFWRARHELEAFDVASSLLAADVPAAVGFAPREGDGAPEILQGMCSRCHAAGTGAGLARARFVADASSITPALYRSVRQRLSLPPTAERAMPPRNAGQMPAWAIERVLAHLAERCEPAGQCQ